MSLYHELKRRNVLRVAIAYLAGSWLLVEVAETIFPLFGFDDTPARILVIVLAIGFPLFLLFSWVFEITPEGLKKEKDIDRAASVTHKTGKQLDRIIIVLLAMALGYFAFDKFVLEPARVSDLVEETAQQARSDALVESYGDKSIAVLPFVNMSADPDQEYFSDGISEELLNLLAKNPELRVIARSSSFSFKGKAVRVADMASELNVNHVLEGSVRRDGNRVRITAQLVDARSDTHLWSETYDRKLDDIFAVQENIARVIAQELLAHFGDFESRQAGARNLEAYDIYLKGRRPVSPKAYEAYLKGLYHLNKWNVKGFAKGLEYFQQAVEMDPEYALAHAGLAESYSWLGGWNGLPPKEAYPKSKVIVMKALELDDTLAEAHCTLADIRFFYDWDWEGAEREYKRAIELNPSYAMAHNNYAFYLTALKRHDDALAEIELARELDPVSLVVNSDLGWAYYFARQYDRAVQQFRRVLELDPNLMISHFALGQVYEQKQMFVESVAAFEKAVSLSPGDPENIAGLGHAYAVAGRREDALKIVARLKQPSQQKFIPSWGIATIYIGLDNKDEAFVWLEKALVDRLSIMVYIQTDPVLDPLRSDPRFQVLVRRMDFPE
jgi:TolB-like protein/Tfp pilus assembly protein PilF